MIFKGKFGITYDDTVMEVPIEIKGIQYLLGVDPRSLIVKYIPAEVQEELNYTWNHMLAQLKRTHGYQDDPREYNKPCDIMTLKNIIFHLNWNNWNDRIAFRFNAFDDEIMSLANVIDYECNQLTKRLDEQFLEENDGRLLAVIEENEDGNNVERISIEIGHYDPFNDGYYADSPAEVIEHRAGSGGGWGGSCWDHSYYYPKASPELLKILKKLFEEQSH